MTNATLPGLVQAVLPRQRPHAQAGAPTMARADFEALLEAKVPPGQERSCWRRWFNRHPRQAVQALEAAP